MMSYVRTGQVLSLWVWYAFCQLRVGNIKCRGYVGYKGSGLKGLPDQSLASCDDARWPAAQQGSMMDVQSNWSHAWETQLNTQHECKGQAQDTLAWVQERRWGSIM